MQQFIPFEDEWDILDRLSPESLIPYHVGVPCRHDMAADGHSGDRVVAAESAEVNAYMPGRPGTAS